MSAVSGQKVVTTAGTAEALGSAGIHGPLMVKALETNSGIVAIGNDGAGDVTVNNGLRLAAGEVAIFDHVSQLSALYLDAALDGEGVSWISLNV